MGKLLSMTARSLFQLRAWGEVILARLGETYVPSELARPARTFRAAHAALVAATRRAKLARERRDAALSAAGRADGSLERAVLSLGKRLVAAGLAPGSAPFAGRSRLRPADVVALEPARAAAAATRIVTRLEGEAVTAPVKRAMAACAEAAKGIAVAGARAKAAQKEYARVLAARDALLERWTTALARLRRRAEHVWEERPDELARVFAAPPDEEPETVFDLHPAPVLPSAMNGVHTR